MPGGGFANAADFGGGFGGSAGGPGAPGGGRGGGFANAADFGGFFGGPAGGPGGPGGPSIGAPSGMGTEQDIARGMYGFEAAQGMFGGLQGMETGTFGDPGNVGGVGAQAPAPELGFFENLHQTIQNANLGITPELAKEYSEEDMPSVASALASTVAKGMIPGWGLFGLGVKGLQALGFTANPSMASVFGAPDREGGDMLAYQPTGGARGEPGFQMPGGDTRGSTGGATGGSLGGLSPWLMSMLSGGYGGGGYGSSYGGGYGSSYGDIYASGDYGGTGGGMAGNSFGGLLGGALGSLINPAIGGVSSYYASEELRDAAQRAGQLQSDTFAETKAGLAPYTGLGGAAAQQYGGMLGLPGYGSPDFTKTPGYEFRLQEGIDALERSQSAKGMLTSGATLKGITNYGQNLASQEYDNYMARLASPLGIGANVGTSLGQIGAAGSALTGRYDVDAAKARANLYLGLGQAGQSAIGGIAQQAGAMGGDILSKGFDWLTESIFGGDDTGGDSVDIGGDSGWFDDVTGWFGDAFDSGDSYADFEGAQGMFGGAQGMESTGGFFEGVTDWFSDFDWGW